MSGVQYSIVVTAVTDTNERIDSDTVTTRTCTQVDTFIYCCNYSSIHSKYSFIPNTITTN